MCKEANRLLKAYERVDQQLKYGSYSDVVTKRLKRRRDSIMRRLEELDQFSLHNTSKQQQHLVRDGSWVDYFMSVFNFRQAK